MNENGKLKKKRKRRQLYRLRKRKTKEERTTKKVSLKRKKFHMLVHKK